MKSAKEDAPSVLRLTPRLRAVRGLKQWIQEGKLSVGERLPAEQGLALALGVSRPTIRAAIRELEADGLVQAMAGRGRVVGRPARSAAARSMMSDTVVILSDVPSEKPQPGQRVQGWVSFIATGAQQMIGESGQHFMMLHPGRLNEESMDRLMSDPPSGVIALRDVALTPAGRDVMAKLQSRHVPLVIYGDGPSLRAYDRVTSDHRAGSYEIAKYLLSRGRKNILRYWALSGAETRPTWLAERDAGYQQAMREAGLPEDGPIVEFPALPSSLNFKPAQQQQHFEASSRMAVGYLLPHVTGKHPIDAVMVGSDGETFGVAAAIRLLGKEPNRDILIAGYDNYWAESFERQFEPTVPVATADKQNVLIGRELVKVLQSRVSGELPLEPQRRVVEPKLIITAAPT